MDLPTIATEAVSLLAVYLPKIGEGAAKKIGENFVGSAGELWRSVKGKFSGDPDAEQALVLMEGKPESKGRQATLAEVLLDKMDDDEQFALRLRELVSAARAEGTRQLGGGDRNALIGGNNSGIVITGDGAVVKE